MTRHLFPAFVFRRRQFVTHTHIHTHLLTFWPGFPGAGLPAYAASVRCRLSVGMSERAWQRWNAMLGCARLICFMLLTL